MASTYTTHYNLEKPNGNDDINVNAINSDFDKIDAAIWNSLTLHRFLTASDDLNNLASEGTGFYVIGNDLPLQCPAGYAWSFVFQIVRNSFCHQYIVKAVSGSVLVREYSGSPSSWTEWKVLSGFVAKQRINYGSNSYVEYWKNGNIGCVYIFYNVSDGTLSAWSTKTIAQIPAGFRPLQETAVRAILDRAGDEGAVGAVNSSGNCIIQTRHNSFNTSGDVLQAYIIYPIAN